MSGLVVDLFAGGIGELFGRRIDVAQFEARIRWAPGDACWEWTGSRGKRGDGTPSYGTFSMKANGKSRNVLAHRLAWMLAHGPIGSNVVVCHRCDNVACVRLEHLFVGTQAENLADMRAKGRGHINSFPRGTKHPSAKLSEVDVVSIRRLRAKGLTFAEIGERFDMHPSTVHDIVRGKTWAHVAQPLVAEAIVRANVGASELAGVAS